MIHATHQALEQPFEEIVLAAKTVIDPIVELVYMFIRQSTDSDQKSVSHEVNS